MKRLTTAGFSGVALAAFAATALATPASAPPPLQPETLKVETMPPRTAHMAYTFDISSLGDGRLAVYDLDRKKVLGQRGAGLMPGIAQSPDHRFTYVATTYFSRGSTGDRTDVLEIHDNRTLQKVGEVVLPAKHGQQVTSLFNTTVSEEGAFVFVTNMTPATSMTIVDVAARKVVNEIDTAACVLAYPSGPRSFTSLCESGKALTVTLDEAGKEVKREQSDRFIDVEHDPVFTHAEHYGSGYVFVSFGGEVKTADFSASPARFGAPWQLLSKLDAKQGWLPGGLQPFAVHKASHRLYVAMHQDTAGANGGSHKEGGTEIWVFDLNTHRRLARWPVVKAKLLPMLTLSVTQDDEPILFGSTGIGLQAFDPRTGKSVLATSNMRQSIVTTFPF
ncbi:MULTISPECIES: amine dehydrogenase large subunit [Cupriavidus]|uniref:amine dehydrogenase large subunit n=1 Tax=Cupriavidus TaxID=106589 RepID=UPI0015E2F17A|nr:amine dehydrogenase large subunit [Cupriavidus pinatubonensis]